MNDIQKMLQAIINGQNALRQELINRIERLEKRVDLLDESLSSKINDLTQRIDGFGKRLVYLEEDAPTREEFDGLEKRVTKLEDYN